MSSRLRNRGFARALMLALLLAAMTAAAGDWVIFKGQVDGPGKDPGQLDPAAFAFKHYPGIFWSDIYYHHLNFPDGSMITVQIAFNRSDVNIAFVYGKPGMKPFTDFVITDFKDAKFDARGFGFTVGKNRVRLEGNQYQLDLDFGKTKAAIAWDIVGPSYTYGDGMVRYPDGESYSFYTLPISWAKARVKAVLDGKEVNLTGAGMMNHDASSIFPAYTPSNWQVFWFFGTDHALAVTDFYTHDKFGRQLTQRLVFVDAAGHEFTSTSFELKWDDWVVEKDIPFRYPRHYSFRAEGGGARLEGEVRMGEVLLREDLYSNLPATLRLIAEQLTQNGWTLDSWSDYTLSYTHDGRTDTYHGRGVARWTDLEEEKK
jgi:hypothetical protein